MATPAFKAGSPVERRRPLQNRLLRALPSEEYHRIVRHLKPLRLHRGQVLHPAGAPIERVYFLMRGVCGVVAVMETGESVEVGTVGIEGISSVFRMSDTLGSVQLLVQLSPAEAQDMPVDRFEEEMDRHGAFRRLVTGYYHAFFSEVVQSVACNRLHSARERYCRRLLTMVDRIGSDTMNVTHDQMAMMLGIQRPAVTVIAHALKHLGSIRYTRGTVTIVDREAVEACACECYRTARRRIAQLLPPAPSMPRPGGN
jgi:CRP-like cAMP-binding protein